MHGWYKGLETRHHELLYLFLELTRTCNLACLHCGSDCTSATLADTLDLDEWLAIIDSCAERFSSELTFVFTGGEPLLAPGLLSLGRRITAHDMRWTLVTNGMLLDERVMSELVDAGVYGVTLSLDGLEGSHNLLRGNPAAFRRAVDAADVLGRSGIPVVDVVTCVYPGNLHELDSLAELLTERHIPHWRLFRIFPSGRAKNRSDLRLSFAETRKMLDWIRNNRVRLRSRGIEVSASCEGFLRFREDMKVREEPYFCRAGINIASVLSDGTITGCTNNDPMFAQGNVRHSALADVWEAGFTQFRNRKWAAKGVCGNCGLFRQCQGNSLHLWHEGSDQPAFCYERDLESSQADQRRGRFDTGPCKISQE